jgi:hypothetical protein
VIGHIGFVSHHLGSCLGAIELIVLCPLMCRVGYFDADIREVYYRNRGLTYLPFWMNLINYVHGRNLQNNLQSPSFPLLRL